MPRKRHVSRNFNLPICPYMVIHVMPRKRHVSRNPGGAAMKDIVGRHASQEACE